MKKRIISLILVVATMFLALTSCSYNYAKDDMTKYATLDAAAFADALTKLVIADGDFGRDEDVRKQKVQDAIASAILKLADDDDKRFDGKMEKYDALYYCYYATAVVDGEEHIFFANQMDESKVANLQLGLISLKDLDKAISEAILGKEGEDGAFVDGVYKDVDIKDYLYATSTSKTVADGDYVAISYEKVKLNDDGTEDISVKPISADNLYARISKDDPFYSQLIGARVGTELGDFEATEKVTVNETETNVKYSYRDVKINSIVKDAETQKTVEGDVIYVTYTKSFKVWEGFDEAAFETTAGDHGALNKDGTAYEYKKVSYERIVVGKKDEGDAKTFLGQLSDKSLGGSGTSISAKETIDGHEVDVTYASTIVNWIVNSETDLAEGIKVDYKLYDEALNDKKDNKKTQTDVYGEVVTLNDVTLTYHIFPMYVMDTKELTAEVVVRDFYTTLASTQTKDHEHTEDDHEHETEFVFATLNDKEYKNGDQILADLIEKLDDEKGDAKDLVSLFKTKSEKDTAVTTALKALTTAQQNLAGEESKSSPDTTKVTNYKKALTDAVNAYNTAVSAANEAEEAVEKQIKLILEAKKGETSVQEALVKDYETYQYDTLETAYESELKDNLAAAIFDYAKANTKYVDDAKLPKRAIKDAYKSILNTYKYDFYEGTYSSGTSSSTTSSETNYKHYNGDFDSYLIAKINSELKSGENKITTIDQAEDWLNAKAIESVKNIILVYTITNAMEAKGHDVKLTKDEIKAIKKNYSDMEAYYKQLKQYGLSIPSVDATTHAEQFDKVFDYLLEIDEDAKDDADALKVLYKNIKYDFKSEDSDSSN